MSCEPAAGAAGYVPCLGTCHAGIEVGFQRRGRRGRREQRNSGNGKAECGGWHAHPVPGGHANRHHAWPRGTAWPCHPARHATAGIKNRGDPDSSGPPRSKPHVSSPRVRLWRDLATRTRQAARPGGLASQASSLLSITAASLPRRSPEESGRSRAAYLRFLLRTRPRPPRAIRAIVAGSGT